MSLAGTWKGQVHTYERDLPITLGVHKDGDIHVQIEGQLETLLNRPRFHDGWLRGRNEWRFANRRIRPARPMTCNWK